MTVEVTPHVILLAVLFFTAQSLILTAGFIMYAMVGEVNRRLPEDQQISYLFWHYFRSRRCWLSADACIQGGALSSITSGPSAWARS